VRRLGLRKCSFSRCARAAAGAQVAPQAVVNSPAAMGAGLPKAWG